MGYNGNMFRFLEYQVNPGENLPQGLPPQSLAVLSPIWRGPTLHLKYPDGEVHIVVGWGGPGAGSPCGVQVFWTRHEPRGPAVCLAIGGDGGLRQQVAADPDATPQGLPFLALAESMIPREVLDVIGPKPQAEPLLLI
jgi:hypothetical protein